MCGIVPKSSMTMSCSKEITGVIKTLKMCGVNGFTIDDCLPTQNRVLNKIKRGDSLLNADLATMFIKGVCNKDLIRKAQRSPQHYSLEQLQILGLFKNEKNHKTAAHFQIMNHNRIFSINDLKVLSSIVDKEGETLAHTMVLFQKYKFSFEDLIFLNNPKTKNGNSVSDYMAMNGDMFSEKDLEILNSEDIVSFVQQGINDGNELCLRLLFEFPSVFG
jgi:hypothetical protein